MSEQCVFDFDAIPKTPDSLGVWREARAKEVARMCARLGLPIGHASKVRFTHGTILRGLLRLAEENLLFDADRKTVILQIDEATFRFSEIAAVVRSLKYLIESCGKRVRMIVRSQFLKPITHEKAKHPQRSCACPHRSQFTDSNVRG